MHQDGFGQEGQNKHSGLISEPGIARRAQRETDYRDGVYSSANNDSNSIVTKLVATATMIGKKLNKLIQKSRVFILYTLFFLLGLQASFAAKIVELNIKGPIGPATVDYLERGIKSSQDADLIVILIDTPGGLYDSTRNIIQLFLLSDVPIITYVSPTGARAASAGTYLMYASTLAAMAPGTQMGAASPVSLGTGFSEGEKDEKKISDGK